jgi:alpha-1,6-mannosyltransferase
MEDNSFMSASKFQVLSLVVLGLLLEIACLEIVRIGDLRTGLIDLQDIPLTSYFSSLVTLHASLLLFWLPFTAAFLIYLIGIYQSNAFRPDQSDRLLIGVILAVAVICRLTLLFSPPTLSDDIFRYVWDGKMQNQGINPYLYPPEAPEIDHLRDEFHVDINNKHISTIYPPLTEMMFRLTDFIWHHPVAMKILFTLCDLWIIVLIFGMLRDKQLPMSRALIYAWNPLVMVEFAGSGHNDTLALGLMLAALLAIKARKPIPAMAYLAFSFLAKFFAVVLIPEFYRVIRRIKPFWLIPLIVIVFYLPYIDAGAQLFHGLMVYGDKWRFNDSIFSILVYTTGSLTYAKGIIAVLFSGIVLFRFFLPGDPYKTAYWIVGAYLLLTPTLQPWYMVWLIPFLCLYPNRAWILLTGLIPISYHVIIQFIHTGIWSESSWIRYVQFIPFYGVLIFDLIRDKLQQTSPKIQDTK